MDCISITYVHRRHNDNELYADPKSILTCTGPSGEDCISLCSSFSYCSDCTNASTGPPEDTLSSLSSERLAEMTPFRFSPTSFISDTLSLPDFEDESQSLGYLELQREVSCRSGNSKAHRPATYDMVAMSTLSSVSSITLQGDDISLGYDTTSLPEDPFPQGLPPSSASSTIGSPPPSVWVETGAKKK